MTTEPSSGNNEIFDADAHDQDTKKEYYHLFDDATVKKMKHYFKVDKDDQAIFLKYLKSRRVPATTPNDV